MARLALCLPTALDDHVSGEAVRHGHEVIARASTAAELAALIDGTVPDAVLVIADPRYLSSSVVAVSDDAGVRVVAIATAETDRRHAASLGLFEVVDADAPWAAFDAVLAGVQLPREPESPTPPSGRGTVIAVWGPVGSPGRTSIAIGIASELAARGHSVVLADVDTHGAAVAPALGMLDEAPGFAAACRLAGSGTLDHTELDRIAQVYRSSHGDFAVLTGIGRPSRWPELSGERVTGTIAVCRTWADYVVLDMASSLENDEEISSDLFAPRRNAATLAAVGEADHVVAVGAADPVGMSRFLRSHADLVEAASTPNVTIVMNRIRASAIGMNPQGQVLQTLSRFGGIESPVLVPYDQSAFDGAVLSGRTLIDSAPRSAARAAIAHLVDSRLVPAPVEDRSFRRRFRRSLVAG